MAKRRKKRNGWKTLAILLTVVLVLGVSVFFTKDLIVAKAQEKVADTLIENVLESAIASDSQAASDAATEAKKIYDSMSDQDKEAARGLIDNNLTKENVKNVMRYVKNADASGLKSYVKNSISESDKNTIKDLYYKYRDELN